MSKLSLDHVHYEVFLFTRVHGVIHAFVKIAREGGIRGLWAGWVPNVQRAALVNLGGSVMQIYFITF